MSITAIMQDRLGFLWIGTQDGLNRYDGYDFRTYRHDETDSTLSTAPLDNFISTLFEDASRRLWVGTRGGGLSRLDPVSDTFTHFQHDSTDAASLSDDIVWTIHQARSGDVWVGTPNGLARYDSTAHAFVRYQPEAVGQDTLGPPGVQAILEDSTGLFWVGTRQYGVVQFDPANGQFLPFSTTLDAPENWHRHEIRDLHEDRFGGLWIGTWGAGLFRWDRGAETLDHYSTRADAAHRLNSDNIHVLYEDPSGTLWVGTRGGLHRFDRDTERFTRFVADLNASYSLSDSQVWTVFEDASGVFWVGTWDGLNKHVVPKFSYYTYQPGNPNSLNHSRVVGLHEDRDGLFWIGTIDGLTRFDPATETFTPYRADGRPGALSHNFIYALQEDRDGVLWVGTHGGGLNRLNRATGTFTAYRADAANPQSLGHDDVASIYEDSFGELWIGTWGGGLNRLNRATGTFTVFRADVANPDSLGSDRVWPIYEDQSGDLWIGTFGGGLHVFDRIAKSFKRYTHDPEDRFSIGSDFIIAITEGQNGNLWIGTRDGGLNHWDRTSGRFTRYTEQDGLANNTVTGILRDEAGYLWISTLNGLSKFNLQTSRFVRTYDVTDGLPDNNFSYGSYLRARDGSFLFGGGGGFIRFYPVQIKENPYVPRIVLTDFQLFNESYRLDSSLTVVNEVQLKHNENFIAFEFAVLDFADPFNNDYRYKLEGRDEKWIEAGDRRYAPYGDLAPRTYVFRVEGSSSDNVWSEEVSIRIVINPAWWQTWWFRFLIVPGLLVAMLAAAYRYRVGKLLEMERLRLRIAGDLHDDIGSNVSSIALLSEMLYDGTAFDEAERRRLLRINQTAGETIGALREIIWFVDPDHDKLGDVIRKMRTVADDLLAGIPYTFQAPGQLPSRPLSMEFRRNVYLMYKEMLHNVVKHARASTVAIEIEHERGVFVLRVQDDGVGFDEQGVAQGHGLKSIRRRAERAGGTVEITSPAGQGTTVTFTKEMENGVKARWWFVAR